MTNFNQFNQAKQPLASRLFSSPREQKGSGGSGGSGQSHFMNNQQQQVSPGKKLPLPPVPSSKTVRTTKFDDEHQAQALRRQSSTKDLLRRKPVMQPLRQQQDDDLNVDEFHRRSSRPLASSHTAARSTSKVRHQQQQQQQQHQEKHQLECWNSLEDLFWDHMREVQNKWNTLKMNDDIWAKLIYFEQNKRLAKAYVSAPVLTIDGSTNGLDGFRIGLSGIDNDYRSLDSIACLRSIGLGIKLKIDSQGNILMRKIGSKTSAAPAFDRCSVWVKNWPPPPSTTTKSNVGTSSSSSPPNSTTSSGQSNKLSSSDLSTSSLSSSSSSSASNERTAFGATAEDWSVQEIEESDISYKIFDMNKFRRQLEERKSLVDNPDDLVLDWRQCVSIISFAKNKPDAPTSQTNLKQQKDQRKILKDPCWLMLINIIAIDVLKSSICVRQQQQQQQLQNHQISKQTTPISRPINNVFSRKNLLASATTSNSVASDYLSPFQLHEDARRRRSSNNEMVTMNKTGNGNQQPQRPSTTIRRSSVLMMANNFNNSQSHYDSGRLRPSSSVASIYSSPRNLRNQSANLMFSNSPNSNRFNHRSSLSSASSSATPASRPSSYYRQYQSTQFLVGEENDDDEEEEDDHEDKGLDQQQPYDDSNVIYTTFTGAKNNSHQLRSTGGLSRIKSYDSKLHYSSTSDSYESSRLSTHQNNRTRTNNNNNFHSQQRNEPFKSPATPTNHYYYGQFYNPQQQQQTAQSRWNLERHFNGKIPYVKQFDESRIKSQSLSNFDWPIGNTSVTNKSQQQRKIDLRSIKSTSFRMNFDDNDSEEDCIEDDEEEARDDDDEHRKENNDPNEDPIDRKKQTSNGSDTIDNSTKSNKLTDQKQPQQKVSTASVGSTTSSSSGCPENDYFISNSSTSMSSSSLQKKSFGSDHQPVAISTSGIAGSGSTGSGNTSDEYEIYGSRPNVATPADKTKAKEKIIDVAVDDMKNRSPSSSSSSVRVKSPFDYAIDRLKKLATTTAAASATRKNSTSVGKTGPINNSKDVYLEGTNLNNKPKNIKLALGGDKTNIKSAISRNRHSNVKTIESLEDEICVHCEQLSDCGYSLTNDEPCDCCCDCDLYFNDGGGLGQSTSAN